MSPIPDEPVVVDPWELELERRVEPEYPQGAVDYGDVRCVCTVFIDQEGVPYDVRVDGCWDPFRASAEAAILQWRWSPPKVDGATVRAQTVVRVTFKLRENVPRYTEIVLALGAVGVPVDRGEAPAVPPVGREPPASTAGLARLWFLYSGDVFGLPGPLALGFASDVRGFRTFSQHTMLLVGVNGTATEEARAALVTGVGIDQRWLGRPSVAVYLLPVHASVGWSPLDEVGLTARGGVNFAFASTRTALPGPAPEVVVGLTLGAREAQGVFGLRLEAGWRREFGADTWTAVGGLGI